MNLSLITKKLFLVLLLILLGYGIWQAQRGYRSALLFEQSQRYREAWSEDPEQLTVENWQAAAQDIEAALELNGNESKYLHHYGLLIDAERSLIGEDISAEETQQILTNAIEQHWRGIRQQPANPYGWAHFARVKALAGQLDADFDLALLRLDTLGPWEKEIHQLVARISQYYWANMSEEGRDYALAILQRALSNPGYDTSLLSVLRGSAFLTIQLCPNLSLISMTEATATACWAEQ